MYPFHYLVNLLNQLLAVLFAILLTIWLKLRTARKAKGLTIEEAADSSLSAFFRKTTGADIRTGLPGTNAQPHELVSFHTTRSAEARASQRLLRSATGTVSRTSSSTNA